jgi:hypothetical protein
LSNRLHAHPAILNRGSPTERLPHFPAPQMSQIKNMVTFALITAHEISLRNGVVFFAYFWVLVAG